MLRDLPHAVGQIHATEENHLCRAPYMQCLLANFAANYSKSMELYIEGHWELFRFYKSQVNQ